MRKNEVWKDDPSWDPVIGVGTLSDDHAENLARQLDRVPEGREDEEQPAPSGLATPSANGQPERARPDPPGGDPVSR